MNSIWEIDIKQEPTLNKDIKTDILIIGGGITGMSIAYHLKDSNQKVTLVERDRIGSGVTKRTTGKLTYLQELIYSKLEKNISFNTAKLYLESQIEAINLVKTIIKENNINCDLEDNTSITYTNKTSDINQFHNEEIFFDKVGIEYKIRNKLPLNIPCSYAIEVKNTAVFHPLKYLKGLKEIINNKIDIYEKTKILNFKKTNSGYVCYTNKYKIECKTLVFAGHYPFFTYPFFFPLKTHIEESYIAAFKSNEIYPFNIITNGYPTTSIRYHKNYQIYLTGSHNLCDKLNKGECFKNLYKKINQNIEYSWSNQDIITSDNLPFIGRVEKNNNNFLIATGYNTWGMTNGSIAGKIISDIILKKENKYIDLFDPHRKNNIQKVIKLPTNIYCSAKSFILTKIKNYSKKNVQFKTINGEKVGIYTDKCEHIVYNTCPHLKCSLVFNDEEKTWDCPCHGSRFDIDGNCIKGPSNYNIKFDKDNK